jgi:hypothetical protein
VPDQAACCCRGYDHYLGNLDTDATMLCAVAQTWDVHYENFTCTTTSANLKDVNCYQTGPTFSMRTLAWRAVTCGSFPRFLCRLPAATTYPCSLSPPAAACG